MLVLLMAAIYGINTSLFESARIDGASSGQIFRKITLPLIRPVMLYVFITNLIGGLQMFDIPYLLTTPVGMGVPNGTTRTITMLIYTKAFSGGRYKGESAAISVLLFLIICVLSAVVFRMMRPPREGGRK